MSTRPPTFDAFYDIQVQGWDIEHIGPEPDDISIYFTDFEGRRFAARLQGTMQGGSRANQFADDVAAFLGGYFERD